MKIELTEKEVELTITNLEYALREMDRLKGKTDNESIDHLLELAGSDTEKVVEKLKKELE
ncbi:MAG: hypothetical protein ACOCZ5_02730 [bacterium]